MFIRCLQLYNAFGNLACNLGTRAQRQAPANLCVLLSRYAASNATRYRPCSELDDLIAEARSEPDPRRHIALYRQIEEGHFGAEGEMPLIPLYVGVYHIAVHHWLEITTNDFGGAMFYD